MNLIDNNIGNNFGTVNAAAVSQDKRKTNSKERTAECYGNEMFRIQFKRYFLKVSNADGVYGRSDECLYKKISSEEDISGDEERNKNQKDTQGEVASGQFADDNCNAGSTIVDGIIGKQNTGNGEACHQCTDDDCYI